MPMRRCTLDGRRIRSLDDLYDALSTQLALPAHFGHNLDALWDVLSTDVGGPFEVVWKHPGDSKKIMGKDFDRVVKVFKDLQKERADFILKIEK